MNIGEFWPQSGALGIYHLSDVNDSSGNSNTLTNNNTVTFDSSRIGNGANFGSSNTNKYLNRATNMGIDGGACTFNYWVKMQTEIGSAFQYFFGQGSNTTKVKFYCKYDYNGGARRLEFSRTKNTVANQTVQITGAIGTTAWNMHTLTYDGTTLRAYINGIERGNTAASGNGTTNGYNGFAIGAGFNENDLGGISYYSSTYIDEFAVFNKALSAMEIRRWYGWSTGRYQ